MKKLFVSCLLSLVSVFAANAATPWWLQQTVCKINPNNCYSSMFGSGFDAGMWDAKSNCWGMKSICPDATVITTDRNPTLIPKADLTSSKINSDFDINVLDGDCFGARRTDDGGRMASVGGKMVKVYCAGTLSRPDEYVSNGEIQHGIQPTCRELAHNGYVAVENGRCYGKYYDPSRYYIECVGSSDMPARIIALNGAIGVTGSSSVNYPTDSGAARSAFDAMQSRSATQKSKYFK